MVEVLVNNEDAYDNVTPSSNWFEGKANADKWRVVV